jgi:hypothetical protein
MTPEDRARAAERLLDDPLASMLLDAIEADAIEAMLQADTDEGRRAGRDTVKTVRAFRNGLKYQLTVNQEAKRPRPGIA